MIKTPRWAIASIRARLTLAALVPLVVILLLVSLAAFSLINAWVLGETQKKVHNDLNSAREILQHERDRIANIARFTSHSPGLVEAMETGDFLRLGEELDAIRRREQLDILNITDPQGRILLRSAPDAEQQPGPLLPFVPEVITGGTFTGNLVLPSEQMLLEGRELAEKTRISVNSENAQETRGMFLTGASVLQGRDGRVLGCLYGAELLNGNLPLVDRIQALIYGKEHYENTAIGSATIFLDDLRIATTVRLRSGERALGTRVSPQVAESVLRRGMSWLARARVVDDWYLTAYEPLLDQGGNPIGALYVGMLEKPFTTLKSRAAWILAGLLALGSALGWVLARLAAQHISRPILELTVSADRIAAGDRSIELPLNTVGEIGQLTRAFNHMTRSLREQDEQLHRLNQGLELEVEQRTEELRAKSFELIQAREELLRNEKLAAIGALAAGVAHEINNPAAIIRGNVEILLMELQTQDAGREETQEILRQTERISRITQDMLSLAREQKFVPEPVQVNRIIEEVLAQVRHHEPMQQVRVNLELDENLPSVIGDSERLRQVLTNILVNALQSMKGKGILQVRSHTQDNYAELYFADTGPGIAPEHLERIFNPFFTTKKRGTGLGLSVSQSILQSMGGTIEARSEPGEGASFCIRLPLVT